MSSTSLIKRSTLQRAFRVLREEGVKSLWFKLLSEAGYRRLLLLERSLEEPIPEANSRLLVTIGILKPSEVDEYLALRVENSPSKVADRLNTEKWCFVARHAGEVIAASWAATDRAWISYLGREIRMRDDEVYVFDSFTRADFRGQAISPAIRVEMMRYFSATGYRRMILGTTPENFSNLRAIRKIGFHTYGIMRCIKVGPWRRDTFRLWHESG